MGERGGGVCGGEGVVVVVNNERGNRNVLKATTWKKKRTHFWFPLYFALIYTQRRGIKLLFKSLQKEMDHIMYLRNNSLVFIFANRRCEVINMTLKAFTTGFQ